MRRSQFVRVRMRIQELTEFMVKEDISRTLEIVIEKIEIESIISTKIAKRSEASRQKAKEF